jgi:cell division protein FtsB
MTLIQPNKQNILLNFILIALILLVTVSVIWLIMLYTKTVSLAHGASTMREELTQLESQNSELKGKMFALLDPGQMEALAASRGMVADRSPEYLPIITAWVDASQR